MNINPICAALVATTLISACEGADNGNRANETGTMAASEPESTPAVTTQVANANLCLDAGPQTPRDISNSAGKNNVLFDFAPPVSEMNLCNMHTHTNAEHKGPGFSVFVNDTDHGGYACNDSDTLTAEELRDPDNGEGALKGVKPGDTMEVHWVYSSCDVAPGEGLSSCLSETCTDPLLRVEAQVFLVVNDPGTLDINDFDYSGSEVDGLHQAIALPENTGTPVLFHGSTTGPGYTQSACSPLQVTWNVRPNCVRIDIGSLHEWAAMGNVFNETRSHGVRQLVTAEELLAPIAP